MKLVLNILLVDLIFVVFIASTTHAQFREQPQQKSSWSVGIEGSYLKNTQSGSFRTDCGCGPYKDGKGNTGLGDVFAEFTLGDRFTIGLRSGLDSKSVTSTIPMRDSAALRVVKGTRDTVMIVTFDQNAIAELKFSYYFLSPYVRVFPFTEGLFVTVGAQFGFLTGSNLKYSRTIVPPGPFPGAHYPDGTNSETLQNGVVAGARSLRVSALLSAGYELEVLSKLSTFVAATYDMPFTEVSDGPEISGVKISSVLVTLGVKYGL